MILIDAPILIGLVAIITNLITAGVEVRSKPEVVAAGGQRAGDPYASWIRLQPIQKAAWNLSNPSQSFDRGSRRNGCNNPTSSSVLCQRP